MLTEEIIRLAKTNSPLTKTQIDNLIVKLGAEDVEENILTIYAIAKDKSKAVADTLFKQWLNDLVLALEIKADNIEAYDSKTVKDKLKSIEEKIKSIDENVPAEEIKKLITFTGKTDSYSGDSLLNRISNIETAVNQIASDIFNIGGKSGAEQNKSTYSMTSGKQTLSKSVMDILLSLTDIHGGDNGPTHKGVNEDVVMSFNRDSVKMEFGDVAYLFPSDSTKHKLPSEQTSMWLSNRKAEIQNIVFHVAANTLDKAATLSICINGIEQKRKASVMPTAQGLIDVSELGISVKIGDKISIKISTESANTGYIEIDNSAILILKGPSKND